MMLVSLPPSKRPGISVCSSAYNKTKNLKYSTNNSVGKAAPEEVFAGAEAPEAEQLSLLLLGP